MGKRIRQWASRILDGITIVALVVSIPLLLGWSFAPARAFLTTLGVFSESSVGTIAALAIVSTVLSLRFLGTQLSDVETSVSDLHAQFLASIDTAHTVNRRDEIQRKIIDSAWQITDPNERYAVILAQNLLGSLAVVSTLLDNEEMSNWNLSIYCLSPHVDHEDIPQSWESTINGGTAVLIDRLDKTGEALKQRGISVSLMWYSQFPALHGARLGNGALVLSLAEWDKGETEVRTTGGMYDWISPSDRTPRADYYRHVFDNWVRRAEADGKPIIIDNKVVERVELPMDTLAQQSQAQGSKSQDSSST